MELNDSPSLEHSVPESPPHRTPAVDPLASLTSLLRLLLSPEHQGRTQAFPASFCAALLQLDTGDGNRAGSSTGRIKEGVPDYPLYVHLATALYTWITTGNFPHSLPPMPGIKEDISWKSDIDGKTRSVVSRGSVLLELWQGVTMQLHVQEPCYSSLRDGSKTVEGRCATNTYRSLRIGDLLLVNETLLLQVQATDWYPTFKDMLDSNDLDKVLPGITTITRGVQVYRQFYTEEKEQANGVLAIHVSRPYVQRQPMELLSDMLNGFLEEIWKAQTNCYIKDLGVDGIRSLLGMRSTEGTMKESLPPPKSALVSSFSMLHSPNVAGSRLTVGARALAKHVHRSSCGWWGVISGTEVEKNALAMTMLQHLMKHAIWVNVHQAPFPIFEIRVIEGYGARWLADGSQFRGFLEPAMEEGYSKKWRH